jgi:hypothetical protein
MKQPAAHPWTIWAFALGYFLCYVPYSALTKALSLGRLPGMTRPIDGFELLPPTAIASLVGMFVFLTAMGWWKHAGHRDVFGVPVPWPGRYTFLSGLCTATIIGTTTLAYTFSGVSIVLMMLLMRGGVLMIAPIVDRVTRRRVRWFSWTALVLSLLSLLVALTDRDNYRLSLVAGVDVAAYVLSYFVRLRFMSRLAKSDDPQASIRYFVEEQMVATPAFVLALVGLAGLGTGPVAQAVGVGFTDFWWSGAVTAALGAGLFSQGTGVFGGLILLDSRENTFCVPVNRASSMLAGVTATWLLSRLLGTKPVALSELAGTALVILAILVLAVPGILDRRREGAKARPVPVVRSRWGATGGERHRG